MQKEEAIKAIRKQNVKEAKKALLECKKLKEYKDSVKEVFIPEIEKYTKPFMIAKVKMAEQIFESCKEKLEDIALLSKIDMPQTNDLTKKEISKLERYHKKLNRKLASTKKMLTKKYANGITIDYWGILQDALNEEPKTNEEKFQVNKRIKKARKNYEIFRKDFKLYFDAKQLFGDSNASNHYDNYIASMYDEACEKVAIMDAEDLEKSRAATASHKAEIYLIKCKKHFAKQQKEEQKLAKKAKVVYVPNEFDAKAYGIDEQGYALRKTGDELQSIADLLAANAALKNALKEYVKTLKILQKEKDFELIDFNPADYGIDAMGYPLLDEPSEQEQGEKED